LTKKPGYFYCIKHDLVGVYIMKVSKKSDYALRALATLSEENGSLLSIRHLASVNNIPKRFLEHIMLDLKNAGFVTGLPGRDGGYSLAVSPSEIKIGKVIRHFDGMLAPIECVSMNSYQFCTQEPKCRFRRIFLDIRNYTARLLDTISLADIASLKPVEIREVLSLSFADGGGI
jgi:Rrf2 family protein